MSSINSSSTDFGSILRTTSQNSCDSDNTQFTNTRNQAQTSSDSYIRDPDDKPKSIEGGWRFVKANLPANYETLTSMEKVSIRNHLQRAYNICSEESSNEPSPARIEDHTLHELELISEYEALALDDIKKKKEYWEYLDKRHFFNELSVNEPWDIMEEEYEKRKINKAKMRDFYLNSGRANPVHLQASRPLMVSASAYERLSLPAKIAVWKTQRRFKASLVGETKDDIIGLNRVLGIAIHASWTETITLLERDIKLTERKLVDLERDFANAKECMDYLKKQGTRNVGEERKFSLRFKKEFASD